jgi:hypothetical protein
LAPLPTGAAIEDSEDFTAFQSALEGLIPSVLAEAYAYWQYEGLDGFRFVVARKASPAEAVFIGLCLSVGNQSWMALHLCLRLAPQNDSIDWLECKLGESKNGHLVEVPYGSTGETKLLYSVLNRLESIQWTYRITRGSPRRFVLQMRPSSGKQATNVRKPTSTSDDSVLRCSFCNQSQAEVRKLVAGPNVFICDECVEVINRIMLDDDPPSTAEEAPSPQFTRSTVIVPCKLCEQQFPLEGALAVAERGFLCPGCILEVNAALAQERKNDP